MQAGSAFTVVYSGTVGGVIRGAVARATGVDADGDTGGTVRKPVSTEWNVGVVSDLFLRQNFDPLQVKHHVAAVLFYAAGEDPVRLIRVIHHRITCGR